MYFPDYTFRTLVIVGIVLIITWVTPWVLIVWLLRILAGLLLLALGRDILVINLIGRYNKYHQPLCPCCGKRDYTIISRPAQWRGRSQLWAMFNAYSAKCNNCRTKFRIT